MAEAPLPPQEALQGMPLDFSGPWALPDHTKELQNPAVRLLPFGLLGPDEKVQLCASALRINNNGEDLFTYHVNTGPFDEEQVFFDYMQRMTLLPNALSYAVYSKRLNRWVGAASLLAIRPDHGSVEVGSIWYSKQAQRSEVNSFTMLLLFEYVFESLGYRRLEWKCNTLNQPSIDAAKRLGFTYEGTFRQHFVSRGCNRDTAWFSILDSEWQEKKHALLSRLQTRNNVTL